MFQIENRNLSFSYPLLETVINDSINKKIEGKINNGVYTIE